jgi:hypothetical protein
MSLPTEVEIFVKHVFIDLHISVAKRHEIHIHLSMLSHRIWFASFPYSAVKAFLA